MSKKVIKRDLFLLCFVVLRWKVAGIDVDVNNIYMLNTNLATSFCLYFKYFKVFFYTAKCFAHAPDPCSCFLVVVFHLNV